MFCKQCGSQLKDGAVFCTNCGAKQTEEATQSAPVGQYSDLDKTVGVFGDFPAAESSHTTPERAAAPIAAQVQTQQATYTPPVQQSAPVSQPEYRTNTNLNIAPQNVQQQSYNQTQAIASPANGKVGFGQAIKLFFTNYVNFTGRASRSEYWFGFLFQFLVTLLTCWIPYFSYVVLLALVIPNLSLSIRRLHDIGKAWPWLLMGLIPFAGFIILIVYYCKASDGNNQWGSGSTGYSHVASGVAQNVNSEYSQPTYSPAQPTNANTPFASAAPAVQPRKVITDNDIVAMAQNHEPLNLHTPKAKNMMDAAINIIVPTYTGAEDLATAMMQCNPQDIKDRVAATDTDTLLVIFKAIGYYIGIGADQSILGLVQQYVLSTLKTRF